jgi:hypothetical protein
MEVVMRRSVYFVFSLFVSAFVYAQPVLKVPVSSQSVVLVTPSHPTFKWSKVTTAGYGYEIYITSTRSDSSSSTIPLASSVGKSKRYRVVGPSAIDTSITLSDTAVAANTIYWWKVRAKTSATAFSAWSKYFTFKTPADFISVTSPATDDTLALGSHYIVWSNNTGVAVTNVKVSYDGGATYSDSTDAGSSTAAVDSVAFSFDGRKTLSASCNAIVYTSSDTGTSGAFSVEARTIAVSSPAAGDTLTLGNHNVIWTNNTGDAVIQVKVSYDGGTTYSDSMDVNSSAAQDSVAFDFEGKKTLSDDCSVMVYTSQDTGKSAAFAVAARYVAVTSPTSGSVSLGQHYVVWENYTGIAVTKVAISLDSGKVYLAATTVNSTSVTDSVLFNFNGVKNASDYCFVRVLTTADADTGISACFSLASAGASFSIPKIFGDPAGTISVPINVKDFIAGDSVRAFDIKLTFDTSFVTYNGLAYTSSLASWIVDTVPGVTYVRISAFQGPGAKGVKSSDILNFSFTVKNDQSIIGQSTTLDMTNSVLSAAGNSALSLNVSGSTDGDLKIYSSISGSLHYFHEKWNGSASYPISGDSLITYYDSTNTANNSVWPVVNGDFKLTSREPDDTVCFSPSASKYMIADISDAINVTDAQLAFKDWHDTLSVRAKIAADVNGDGLVNSSDAMAIMEISVDTTYLTGIGLSNWVFVDSANLATFESASDSMTGWYAKQQHFMSYLLHSQMTRQDFWGVLRGDVNFDFASAPVATMRKASSVLPALFSTDARFSVRPGDEVWIPLNIVPGTNNVIGGFNASLIVDPQVLSYTGEFKKGPTIPNNANWYVVAKSDARGRLSIAATDFSLAISPITMDGPALLFKYIVKKDARLGSISTIGVKASSVVDKELRKMSSSGGNSRVEVSRMGSTVVKEYGLSQNYPNPFNPSTTIEFALPQDSKVDIKVFNILGQQMATLFSGYQTSGYHQVTWYASDFSSGVYFYVMNAHSLSDGAKFQSVKKLMLMK